MEHFFTIQGEGYFSGKAAYFIRLAGCDVGCVWCDVKDSWDNKTHPLVSIPNIVLPINDTKADFVVITGGEPTMYDLTALTKRIHKTVSTIAIETSGCYTLKGEIDWYCFSPKKFKAPLEEAYMLANELKVVISHSSDFAWAENHAAKINQDCKLYLQPEWTKQERFLPEIIEYIKQNPKWRISLQTHKYMQIP